MIGTRPRRLSFLPMSSLAWRLLPLCDEYDEHIEEPSGGEEPVSLSALRRRMNDQLAVIQQLQRRQRCIGRIYVRLRRQRAHAKAQRALRWKLRTGGITRRSAARALSTHSSEKHPTCLQTQHRS